MASKFTLGLYQLVHQADSWPEIHYNKIKTFWSQKDEKSPSHVPPIAQTYIQGERDANSELEVRQKGNKNSVKTRIILSLIFALSTVAPSTPVRNSFPQLLSSSLDPLKGPCFQHDLRHKAFFLLFPGMLNAATGSCRGYINHSCFL